ncbi:MAG: PKD domain-containing protein [Chitinophagaceae bacterium]
MKRFLVIITSFFFFLSPAFAAHIKGGEVFYEYLGAGAAGFDRFRITVRLYIDCASMATQIDATANVGIYQISDNTQVAGSPFTLESSGDNTIRLTTPSACIVNPSPVCYRIRSYSKDIELPQSPSGYTAIFQRCCRINGIANLNPSNLVGASYTCEIHGYTNLKPGEVNSNPQFLVKDTVLICQYKQFSLNYGATDADGDSLSYEFCSAYNGGSSGQPVISEPPPPNRLLLVGYSGNFSGAQPLGPNVTINAQTGIVSGTAPAGGDYVVCVCITEWRRGKPLSTHRKDFILRVDANCDFAAAQLNPTYITCDGFDFSFQNEAPFSSLIHTYTWDFGVAGINTDTSSAAKPKYVYPVAGVYPIKLIINKGEECSDSAKTLLSVFPGFKPAFEVVGSCIFNPFVFTDRSTTSFGTISRWRWNFGDETTAADTSIKRIDSWKYPTLGYKSVTFSVESSLGCKATIVRDSIEVKLKPDVRLLFRDTLICSIDTLLLTAMGGGSFSWIPNTNTIINANTSTPSVFPKTTTSYQVTVNDNGCVNTDVVKVRVIDFVTLELGPDSTICLTDAFQFSPQGDGLKFSWAANPTLSSITVKRPVAIPVNEFTTYQLTASVGKCQATDQLTIRAVPFPVALAGEDAIICYEDTVMLNGKITGDSYNWSPASTLINPGSLNPLAYPLRTTSYVLTVYDVLGCPKPKRDTVVVTVKAKILANAGRDTSVVIGQPLKLSATGGEFFDWSPPFGLSRNNIQSPTAMLSDNMTYIVKVSNGDGCFNYDTVNVKVFKTQPDIFVPNAFTPGKSTNNRFRPIPVGISVIDFFRVYNRWGQLLYSSNDPTRGWDGTFGGKNQDAGTYVWMVQGSDFTGKKVFRKGSMVLIR